MRLTNEARTGIVVAVLLTLLATGCRTTPIVSEPCPRATVWEDDWAPTVEYAQAVKELKPGIVYERLNALERYCFKMRAER